MDNLCSAEEKIDLDIRIVDGGEDLGLPPPILDPDNASSLSSITVTVKTPQEYQGTPIMLSIRNEERSTWSAETVEDGDQFTISETSIVYAFYEKSGILSLVSKGVYTVTIRVTDTVDVLLGVYSLPITTADSWIAVVQSNNLNYSDDISVLAVGNGGISVPITDTFQVALNNG